MATIRRSRFEGEQLRLESEIGDFDSYAAGEGGDYLFGGEARGTTEQVRALVARIYNALKIAGIPCVFELYRDGEFVAKWPPDLT